MQQQIARVEQWLSTLMDGTEVRLQPEQPFEITLNNIPVSIVWLPEAESLTAAASIMDVGTATPAGFPKIVRAAMEANFQWNGTDGGAIGLSDDGLLLLQNRWFLPVPSEQELLDSIARLVVAAGDLAKEYANFDAAADIPPTALKV